MPKPAGDRQPGPLDYSAAFEAWWLAYPRKIGKSGAWASYRRAVRLLAGTGQVDPEGLLLAACKGYAEAMRREGREERLIAHATTWLNQGRWQDGQRSGQPRRPGGGQSVAF